MKTISKIALILSILRLIEHTDSSDIIVVLTCLFVYASFNHTEWVAKKLKF